MTPLLPVLLLLLLLLIGSFKTACLLPRLLLLVMVVLQLHPTVQRMLLKPCEKDLHSF
jgi:hypothetical protein